MATKLKELFDEVHALEYLSLNAIKMLATGRRIQVSKTEFEAKLKYIAQTGVKAEIHIENVNKHRNEMIGILKKNKKIILNFIQWLENPKNDALVLVRIPHCTCIDDTDPKTGIPTIVFYYGSPENNKEDIFMVLIGIREFTGPHLSEPDRPYTRTTRSEAFQVLIGSQRELPPHEMNEKIVNTLKQKGHVDTQSFNALGVINIVDYSIKGPIPWVLGNILFMVRDRKP